MGFVDFFRIDVNFSNAEIYFFGINKGHYIDLAIPVFTRFRIIPHKIPFHITIIIDRLIYVFLIFAVTYSTDDISCINTSNRRAGVPPSLFLTIVSFLLFSHLFIRDFTDRQRV